MDFSDFDTAVDSAHNSGGLDFDSAVDSAKPEIDWSQVGEEGLLPLAPTDVIGKALQLPGEMFKQKTGIPLTAPLDPMGFVGRNLVPSTMNQFAGAITGGPVANELVKGAIGSPIAARILSNPKVQSVLGWAADKIGLDSDGLASLINKPESGITKPGAVAPAGSEQLSKMAADNYVDKASKLQDVIGPPEPDIAIGNKISLLVQQRSQAARKIASAPFDTAQQLAQELPILPQRPTTLAQAVQEAGLLQADIPPSLRLGKLGAFLRDEASLNPKAVSTPEGAPVNEAGSMFRSFRSIPELLGIRQELAGLARGGNQAFGSNMPGLAGQSNQSSKFFYDLVDAADKDIASMSEGTPLMESLSKARAGWKVFKDVYSNPAVESLMTKNPSDIAEFAFKSPENVNALSQAGGPQAINLLRKGIMNDIVNQGASGLGNTNIRNPNAVLDKLLTTKEDEMSRIFDPSHVDALRAFAGAREHMLRSLPKVGETSTTAAEKALAIGSKFLPPQGKVALETLKALGTPGLGAMAGVPLMRKAAQNQGFSLGDSLPTDQASMLQKMKEGMQ